MSKLNQSKSILVSAALVAISAGSAFAQNTEMTTTAPRKDEFTAPKFSGDMRFRHEQIEEEKAKGDNSESTRTRQRVRLRLKMDAALSKELSVVARVATGDADAVSTNETLDGGFSSKGVRLDMAYIKASPLADLTLQAGKMKNPFTRPGGSQLVWDSDLTPEGLTASYDYSLSGFTVGATAGSFWVNELKETEEDVMLRSGELRASYGNSFMVATLGANAHTYTNLKDTDTLGFNGGSGGNLTLADEAGNDLGRYANDYALRGGFAEVKFKTFPASVFYDVVKNTAVDAENSAWLAGFSVGETKGSLPVKFGYNYRSVEKESVLGVFADSDFGGGKTDVEGHVLSLSYGITDAVKVSATQFLNTVNASDKDNEKSYNRGQADLSVVF